MQAMGILSKMHSRNSIFLEHQSCFLLKTKRIVVRINRFKVILTSIFDTTMWRLRMNLQVNLLGPNSYRHSNLSGRGAISNLFSLGCKSLHIHHLNNYFRLHVCRISLFGPSVKLQCSVTLVGQDASSAQYHSQDLGQVLIKN